MRATPCSMMGPSIGSRPYHQAYVQNLGDIVRRGPDQHQAVVVLGNENRDSRPMTAQSNAPIHAKALRDGPKLHVELVKIELEPAEVPLNASMIETLLTGRMLLEIQNVAVLPVQKFGNSRVEPLAVRTLHQ